MKYLILLTIIYTFVLVMLEVPVKFNRNILFMNRKQLRDKLKPLHYLALFLVFAGGVSGLAASFWLTSGTGFESYVIPAHSIIAGYSAFWIFSYCFVRIKGFDLFVKYFLLFDGTYLVLRPAFIRKFLKSSAFFANSVLLYLFATMF